MLQDVQSDDLSDADYVEPAHVTRTGPLTPIPIRRHRQHSPITTPLPQLPTQQVGSAAYTPVSGPGRIIAVSMALGWSVVLLFYGQMLGVAYPLFVAALLVALFGLGKLERVAPVGHNLWLVAPILFFSVMVFVRANSFVTMLNIAASGVLLVTLFYYYSVGRAERLGVFGYLLVFLVSTLQALMRPAPMLRTNIKLDETSRRRVRHRLLPVLRGVVIAAPVLLVFAVLLASADKVFSNLLGDVFHITDNFDIADIFWRVAIALSSAWLVSGLLLFAITRHAEPDAAKEIDDVGAPFHLGFIETTTLLVLVDLLFAVFAWIQFSYLFGMQEWAARGAWDYRDYARRGFGELIAVSVLTLMMILSLHHVSWRETPRQTRTFRWLCTVMVGLVLVFLASAWQRMFYWEQVDAYMFTQTRIYVRVFIAWLAALMAWLAITLWALPKQFGIGALVVALGFIATLNVVNPDASVAQYNLESYARTGIIDEQYLDVLSEDAVPNIVAAYDHAAPDRKDLLKRHLSGRLLKMDADNLWEHWQAWQLSRDQADRLLDVRRGELK